MTNIQEVTFVVAFLLLMSTSRKICLYISDCFALPLLLPVIENLELHAAAGVVIDTFQSQKGASFQIII